MVRYVKKWHALFLALALAFALGACGATNTGATPENADTDAATVPEGAEAAVTEDADTDAATAPEGAEAVVTEDAQTRELRLGASPFVMTIPDNFQEGVPTEKGLADDQIARYLSESDDMPLDFDVYEFSKEGYPDTLAEFVTKEAAEYNATEMSADAVINDIPVGYYRSVEESDGVSYNVITYAFEANGEYVEVAFWLRGDNAEEIVIGMINSLSKTE